MSVTILPDATRLVTDFLRADPDVSALCGDRVYSIIPAERTYPLVVVSQIGDVPFDAQPRYWWATAADLRMNVYADTANQARYLLETCRGALMERGIGEHVAGTISLVRFLNAAYFPDDAVVTAAGRPIPRWTTLLTVTCHPNASEASA